MANTLAQDRVWTVEVSPHEAAQTCFSGRLCRTVSTFRTSFQCSPVLNVGRKLPQLPNVHLNEGYGKGSSLTKPSNIATAKKAASWIKKHLASAAQVQTKASTHYFTISHSICGLSACETPRTMTLFPLQMVWYTSEERNCYQQHRHMSAGY